MSTTTITRLKYRYPVTPKLIAVQVKAGDDPVIESFALVRLTVDEENNAMERGGGNVAKIAVERILESLREVNKKPVNTNDGSAQAAFSKANPKVRQLIQRAFLDQHIPNDEESAGFLEAMEVVSG